MCVCVFMADTFRAAVTGSDVLQQGKCISLIGTLFEMYHAWPVRQWNSVFLLCVCVCVCLRHRLAQQQLSICNEEFVKRLYT